MGWVPDLLISSENSNAPHKLFVSEIPMLLILLSLQKFFKSSILIVPSQIENWVCTLK